MILLTDEEIRKSMDATMEREVLNRTELLEIAPILNKGVAKAQLKKVVEWMKENHIDCWQIILKEVED